MKKQFVCLGIFISSICLSESSLSAQNVDRKKVKTQFLNFPIVNLNETNTYNVKIYSGNTPVDQNDIKISKGYATDVNSEMRGPYLNAKEFTNSSANADVSIEIAFGDFQLVSKAMKDYKIPCTVKGAPVNKDNIMECPAYYYEVKYSLPAVLVVKNKAGEILITKEVPKEFVFDYGRSQLAGYLKASDLELAFNNAMAKNEIAKEALQTRIQWMIDPIQECFSFFNEEEKLEIATGSGKANDYSQLDLAQETAIKALENYKKSGVDPSAALQSAIAIWDKELATLNAEDKEARINKKIAVDLHGNKAIAYMYMYDFDNAEKSMMALQTLFQGMFNQSQKDEWDALEKLVVSRKKKMQKNYAANKSLLASIKKIEKILMMNVLVSQKDALYNPISTEPKYSTLHEEHLKFTGSATSLGEEAAKKQMLDAFESMTKPAENNGAPVDYNSKVTTDAAGEKSLKLFPFGGDNFETLPLEVCNISGLTSLNATGIDKFTNIPAEIANLKDLKELNLYSNNGLKTLPAEIGMLSKLETLDLSFCENLTDLPNEIKNLSNLKKLKINGTKISASRIAELKTLLPNCKIK